MEVTYKYYYVYKIICTAGSFKDHYYIGQHKTNNIDDGYRGSGVYINKYFKKYPDDYIKEILCFCKNQDDLNQKEAEYIGNLYETDSMCLNLKAGGNIAGISAEVKKRISQTEKGKIVSNKTKKIQSIKAKERCANSDYRAMISKTTKEAMNNPELKNKLRKMAIERAADENVKKKFKQKICGRIWVTKGEKSLRIYKESLKEYISMGYHKGRNTVGKEAHNKGEHGERVWVKKGDISKQIKKDKLQEYLDNGYTVGRFNLNEEQKEYISIKTKEAMKKYYAQK